jgi:hypothetical protein
VYGRTGSAWSETQRVGFPADADGTVTALGTALALTPDASLLLAGAPGDHASSGYGAVFAFVGSPALPPPEIHFLGAQPAANANGWESSAVTLTWGCNDPLSAVPATVSQTISTEGANQSATGTCTDANGRSASDTEGGISIDKTPPATPTVQADRAPDFAGGGGWYRDTVTVTFKPNGDPAGANGTPGSGIDPATVPAPATFTTDGSHTVSSFVRDLVGNESPMASLTVQVDSTAPALTATYRNADGSAYTPGTWKNQAVTVTFACSDSGSGVASFSAPATVSADGAAQSVEGSCTDNVGHTTTKSFGGIQIDTTAPEAYLAFDPGTDAVELFGTDSGSGVPSGSVSPVSVSGHELTYKIVDAAGNSLVVVLEQTGKAKDVQIQVVSLSYDGDAAVTAPKNDLEWSWTLAKGALSTLTQDLRVGAKKAKVHVVADYSANTGKTTIHSGGQTSKRSGLVLVTVATAAGKLVLDY